VGLKVLNTLSGRKEDFQPRDEGQVSIYICGVTPYSSTHLGHARPSVFWDTVIRYLEFSGYEVRAVQNVTDVNEKVAARAVLEGVRERELAEKYNAEYDHIMHELNVRPVDEYPWVSDHMDGIISMIEDLIEKEHAYVVEGEVYFSVASYPQYGKLSGQTPDDLKAGARIQVDDRKKHPADFALWKKAEEGMDSWDSPWGPGRPGWHIECSAMSLQYLGFGFDFHGGGTDLLFPHHENEVAQSETWCGGEPFVRYWVHHGMVTGEDGKMSKSLGNFVTVEEVLERFRPEVLRQFLLSAHYSKPLKFSDRLIRGTESAWDRLVNSVSALHQVVARTPRPGVMLAEQEARPLYEIVDTLKETFTAAMDDAFNTPRASAALFEAVRAVNAFINAPDFELSAPVHAALSDVLDQVEICCRILGIWPREGIAEYSGQIQDGDISESLLQLLIEVREQARARRLWDIADTIRDRLSEMGIKLEDTSEGTRIRRGDS